MTRAISGNRQCPDIEIDLKYDEGAGEYGFTRERRATKNTNRQAWNRAVAGNQTRTGRNDKGIRDIGIKIWRPDGEITREGVGLNRVDGVPLRPRTVKLTFSTLPPGNGVTVSARVGSFVPG